MSGQQVGYTRVSSLDQNPGRQLDGVAVDRTFTFSASGRSTARPQLEAMLAFVQDGDMVLVHCLLRQLRAAPRKPARPRVELQQQRETQPRRATLAGHQLLFILKHSPVLDQLVHFNRRPAPLSPSCPHLASSTVRDHPPAMITAVWGWWQHSCRHPRM